MERTSRIKLTIKKSDSFMSIEFHFGFYSIRLLDIREVFERNFSGALSNTLVNEAKTKHSTPLNEREREREKYHTWVSANLRRISVE